MSSTWRQTVTSIFYGPGKAIDEDCRLPSQGRDIALAIRHSAGTRALPLVFVEGNPAKVEEIRRLLPDALYTTWKSIGETLKRAAESPPANPVVPASVFAGYSGTPLPKKLGIKPGFVVALVDAPPDFRATLGELPEGVEFRTKADARSHLILWFVKSRCPCGSSGPKRLPY